MLKKRPTNVVDWQKCTFNTPRARNDVLLKMLEKKLADDKAFKETLGKEAKCERDRFSNRISNEEHEINFVERLENIRDEFQKRKLALLKKKEQLFALDEEKRQNQLEEKRRLQLLQNSEEFRDFERQLLRARVAKQQAVQIKNKEAQAKVDKEIELEQSNRLKSERDLYLIIEEQQKLLRDLQQRHYQNVLLDQMDKKREQIDEITWQERERRKRETDEIIKELQEERKQALEKRIEKRREVQHTYEDVWRIHENLKEKEKIEQEIDARKNQEYLKGKEEREKNWQESQNQHLQQINELKEKLGRLLFEEQQKREHSERERLKLQQIKLYQDQQNQDQMTMAIEQKKRYVAKDSIIYQYRLREAQLYREKADEEKHRYSEIAKFAKSAALERQFKQVNKEKQVKHLRQLKNMMEEMTAKSADEKVANELFVKQVEENQKQNTMAIEAEKMKILKNEMTELWGYLPKSVLRSAGRYRNNCLAPI